MATSKNTTHATIDHDEIRSWAEERGAKPSVVPNVRGPGPGILRLDLPGYSEGRLEEIEWDEWFEKFDASNLAFIYQEQTAGGEKSNFNKLVARESIDLATGKVRPRSARARSSGKSSSTARGRTQARSSGRRGSATTSRGGRKQTTAKKPVGGGKRKASTARGRAKSSRSASQRSGARSR